MWSGSRSIAPPPDRVLAPLQHFGTSTDPLRRSICRRALPNRREKTMRLIHPRLTMTMMLAVATILILAAALPNAAAAESERDQHWQFSVPLTFTSGASYDSQEGTSIDVSDDLGWGFSFGYNLNKHLLFGCDFTWLSANFNATVATDSTGSGVPDSSVNLAGTLDASNLQFFAQYNIMKGRITPFVRGSIGWSWIDSNIPSGPATGTCWWDPWYGYVCNTWQPTYSNSQFPD